jgi:hypothetical protein
MRQWEDKKLSPSRIAIFFIVYFLNDKNDAIHIYTLYYE